MFCGVNMGGLRPALRTAFCSITWKFSFIVACTTMNASKGLCDNDWYHLVDEIGVRPDDDDRSVAKSHEHLHGTDPVRDLTFKSASSHVADKDKIGYN